MSLRTLIRRVKRIEDAVKPRPSPIVLWYGTFDAWVESQVLSGMFDGTLDNDFVFIVAALRKWEDTCVWGPTYVP